VVVIVPVVALVLVEAPAAELVLCSSAVGGMPPNSSPRTVAFTPLLKLTVIVFEAPPRIPTEYHNSTRPVFPVLKAALE